MSEKSDQFLAAIDALMKIKELRRQTKKDSTPAENGQTEKPKSGAPPFDYATIKSALDTLLKMKEQDGKSNEAAKEEPLMENKQSEEPQSSASEPDYIPEPDYTTEQSVSSYSPKHEFSWQNEARIAYNPARPRPVRQERTGTPSQYSWPADRRWERRGTAPVFRTPTYRYREENFALNSKAKNDAAPASAQPLRNAGRDASVGRVGRAQYGF